MHSIVWFRTGCFSWRRYPQSDLCFPCGLTYQLDLVLWSMLRSQHSPSSFSFSVLSWSSSSCFFMKTDSSVKVMEMFSAAPASEETCESQLWVCCQKNNASKKDKTSKLQIFWGGKDDQKIQTDDPNYSTFGMKIKVGSSWVWLNQSAVSGNLDHVVHHNNHEKNVVFKRLTERKRKINLLPFFRSGVKLRTS